MTTTNMQFFTALKGDISTTDTDHAQVENQPSATQKWNIPGLLRGIGVLALLVALYGFFMKGWDGGNDLLRFSMLLGHTLLLALIGVGSGYCLKEGKSARLLLMLSLISVVPVFSILGAFIYADFGQSLNPHFISALRWNLNNSTITIAVTISSIVALLPLITIALRVLARGISNGIFSIFTLGNMALLLPVRDSLWIGIIALTLCAYAMMFSIKTSRQCIEVKTREGMFVLILQFAPLATLLIRNLWLHDAIAFLYASSYALAFIILRQMSLVFETTSAQRLISEITSVILAILTGFNLFRAVNYSLSYDLSIIFGTLICAAMIHEISLRAGNFQPQYRRLATLSMVIALLGNFTDIDSTMYLIAVFTSGIFMICLGFTQKQRSVLLGGVTLFIASMVKLIINLWFDFDVNGWALSAVLGIVAILLASLLESQGNLFKQQWHNYRLYFADWSN